jgi:hypothetical protein
MAASVTRAPQLLLRRNYCCARTSTRNASPWNLSRKRGRIVTVTVSGGS